ncbi:hypothetical protein ACCD05_02800, partial [Rhizobium sp. Rhizsp42]
MFSRAEYDRRIALARDAMASSSADLLLVDSGELLAWLTGYTVSETMYRGGRFEGGGGGMELFLGGD